jgi:uncharacterized repeat protein (TIGR03803 family)
MLYFRAVVPPLRHPITIEAYMSGFRRILPLLVTLLAMTLFFASNIWAQVTEQDLHDFDSTGNQGQSTLLQDSTGRLFGTTYTGGNLNCGFSEGCGTVFVLHQVAGAWGYTRLYTFHTTTEGLEPRGNLVFDAAGNLYGTTASGGGAAFPGTVFKLTAPGSGRSTLTNIHVFGGSGDGTVPWGGLTIDASGNLYGTTRSGGAHSKGTVFKLTPSSDGSWSESVLYSFGASSSDGNQPMVTVTLDTAGNIYGTTEFGGTKNFGTVFQLSPNSSGGWTETVIHSVTNNEWPYPVSPILIGATGKLYGSTSGGAFQRGEIFELAPGVGGTWTEKLIYTFNGTPSDGSGPEGPLVLDSAGNFYGTTVSGGLSGLNNGTVFQLHPNSDGAWSEHVVYSFAGGTDGIEPEAGITFGRGGAMFGMTVAGGTQGQGMIFQITP